MEPFVPVGNFRLPPSMKRETPRYDTAPQVRFCFSGTIPVDYPAAEIYKRSNLAAAVSTHFKAFEEVNIRVP
jgi:hypothetical protein